MALLLIGSKPIGDSDNKELNINVIGRKIIEIKQEG